MFESLKKRTIEQFQSWPNGMLSAALIAAAIVLVVIALSPSHPLFKAVALAYVVLP